MKQSGTSNEHLKLLTILSCIVYFHYQKYYKNCNRDLVQMPFLRLDHKLVLKHRYSQYHILVGHHCLLTKQNILVRPELMQGRSESFVFGQFGKPRTAFSHTRGSTFDGWAGNSRREGLRQTEV